MGLGMKMMVMDFMEMVLMDHVLMFMMFVYKFFITVMIMNDFLGTSGVCVIMLDTVCWNMFRLMTVCFSHVGWTVGVCVMSMDHDLRFMVTVTVSTGIAATATAESTAVTAVTGRAGYNG